ncbi:MAG: undecaprenyldiphospho-muramoylpentapeptide beta-N-acetylglucosaminyltransferase [Desulfobacterales bacterium]|nr:undecaprenyldiphospho-muramoylpentapeptide beta-N-acetylglucosaminyltransferase [Desulfobacterales bacterium]
MAENQKSVLIAGGGTGGHLFPGIAIAQAFKARNPNNNILFVSAGKPLEKTVLAKAGFQHKTVTAEGIKRRGLKNQLVSVLKIPKGVFESVRIIKNFDPDIVVGVGGYSAGPVVIAAWLLGIKIVLHEQNILPGITNRILSYFADQIYISFKNTGKNALKPFPANPNKVCYTGNPVREEILAAKKQKCEKSKAFNILIIGGSQGAHSVNMAVAEALGHIKEKEKYFFTHQTGSQDIEMVKNAYAEHGISYTVRPFFDDMAEQYHKADLMICRAGATTVAEVTAIGKSVIFIPYPFAADNHQVLNAQILEHEGAAEMILQKNLTGEILAKRIEYYAKNPGLLKIMAEQAENFGRPDAADVIVDNCYSLMDTVV